MFAAFKTIIFLVASILIVIAALLMPVHLRSVDLSVVKSAGAEGDSAESKAREALNAAYIGPAHLISQTAVADPEVQAQIQTRIDELLIKNPEYAISGGPDPDFEDFVELVRIDPGNTAAKNAVLSILLPRTERASLVELLSASNNANVNALLLVRNLPGLVRLHPADHAAGAPYDAGVLTLALLTEGGHFRPGLARKIGDLASQAALGTPAAISAIENLVISTLTMGRQLDYRSLCSLASVTESPRGWAQMAALFRTRPDQTPLIFTALVFSASPDSLYRYLAEQDKTGQTDLAATIQSGPDAVRHLLDSNKPIFLPHTLTRNLTQQFAPYRPDFFVDLTLASHRTALIFKLVLLSMAGLLFAFSAGAAWRGSQAEGITVSRSNPAVMARDSLISLVFALTLWTLFEPEILQSTDSLPDTGPRIEFAVADALQSLQSPVRIMQELNTVTLLVLALFFIIQLVIYTFSLIKLREISKQTLHPNMKLRLLENEENLFDCGLYVGLGGTVLSLILVAVGVVEASLMAAYASTLFGIIFVALLKILHLRPYRRKLILEAGSPQNNPQAGTLMKNIEL